MTFYKLMFFHTKINILDFFLMKNGEGDICLAIFVWKCMGTQMPFTSVVNPYLILLVLLKAGKNFSIWSSFICLLIQNNISTTFSTLHFLFIFFCIYPANSSFCTVKRGGGDEKQKVFTLIFKLASANAAITRKCGNCRKENEAESSV